MASKFTKDLQEPFASIKNQPFHFAVWVGVGLVLGLAGFWLPILLEVATKDGKPFQTYEVLLGTGVLESFCVVILADGVATTLVTAKAGSNITSAGIRGLIGAIAIIWVFLSGSFLVASKFMNLYGWYHLIITIGAILLASYMYCFRSTDWEKSVEDYRKKDDKESGDLGEEATTQSQDDTGVKL